MTNFDGVTALTMGLDLKGLNQNLQAIAQLTILKHSAAMLAAADGRASPYVLPQKDLDQIVNTMQRRKSITLSHNLADVKTTAMIENEKHWCRDSRTTSADFGNHWARARWPPAELGKGNLIRVRVG